jgi:hypothetical protein
MVAVRTFTFSFQLDSVNQRNIGGRNMISGMNMAINYVINTDICQ